MKSNLSANETDTTKAALSIREKLCYGLGDVSHGLAVSSISFWLLIYLTDVAGLGATIAGVAIMIGRAWDAVTDPLMGWITDNTRSRWGKRRPYLLFGAIPYAIAYAALWMVPEYQREVYIFAYVTVTLLIFNTCLTVVFVPYTTLTAAITNDYNERTSLTGYRMTASQTSFVIGAAVPSALVLWIASDPSPAILAHPFVEELFGAWSHTPRQGYMIMSVLFAIIMIASIWTAFFGTRERNVEGTEAVQELDNSTPFDYASSILDELQGNKPFRISVFILLLSNCAASLVAVSLPYFIQYALDMQAHQTRLIFTIFVTAIICVPIWVILAKRFGKAETYRVAMILYIFTLCALPLVEPGEVLFAYSVALFAGVFHAAALMIPWAIVPDVVEFDELRTGKRREGLFYGGTTFSYKLATALAVFSLGWALDFIGYIPNQPQTPEVVAGLKFMIGPAAALLLFFGAYLSRRYPLSAERHQKIVAELKAKRLMEKE